MSHKQTPERAAWTFWCSQRSTAWGRCGFEPPTWSRCLECLGITAFVPPAKQLALFGEKLAGAGIPVHEPEPLV